MLCSPVGRNDTDDAVAIREAFAECGHGDKVVFLSHTYYVKSVMNTSGLEDVDIELHGTLWVGFLSSLHQFTLHSDSLRLGVSLRRDQY